MSHISDAGKEADNWLETTKYQLESALRYIEKAIDKNSLALKRDPASQARSLVVGAEKSLRKVFSRRTRRR